MVGLGSSGILLLRLAVAVMIMVLVERLLPGGKNQGMARWALGLLLISALAKMIAQMIGNFGI